MNALLMCIFYSQGMHRVCKAMRQTWPKQRSGNYMVYDIFDQLVMKLQDFASPKDKIAKFKALSLIRPEHILEVLHSFDKSEFFFNPRIRQGFSPYSYTKPLMKLLNIKFRQIYYNNFDLVRDTIDGDTDCFVIIMRDTDDDIIPNSNLIINGNEFVIDSVLLTNHKFNDVDEGDYCTINHLICGITCQGDKYVYNGWLRKTQTPSFSQEGLPCELMPFDWLEDKGDFCLNTALCKLERKATSLHCFNFTKGFRGYIYVNKTKHLGPKMYNPKTPMKPRINIQQSIPLALKCVRNNANFTVNKMSMAFDFAGKDEEDDGVVVSLRQTSPKTHTLVEKIRELDNHDLISKGTTFKHMIFTDIKKHAKYLAKILAKELNIDIVYDTQHRLKKNLKQGLMVMCSGTIYKKPMSVSSKKKLFEAFNERPLNIYGEKIRFVILDNGFKEGIDLYDVKYVHMFEPPLSLADRKQVIGRATRVCGQKGLPFEQGVGWPLHVFLYDVALTQQVKERKYMPDNTLHDIVNYDNTNDFLEEEVERLAMQSSVDYLNNIAIHRPGKSVKDDKYTWVVKGVENLCTAVNTSGKFTLNPTQAFISNTMNPKSSVNGMLLWHSTGSGKTLTAVATAADSFKDYTILWVTRSSLKSDMMKNMSYVKNTKNWLPTMSYKQFTNLIQGKNEMYAKLKKINSGADILEKTLLIIDEAHKLINPGDLLTAERPDTDKLAAMLKTSYETSGKNACKVILMTATPIVKEPFDLIQMINLLKPASDVISSKEESFERKRWKQLLATWMKGNLSYLNREKDARQFAIPIIKTVLTNITERVVPFMSTDEIEAIRDTKMEDGIEERDALIKLNVADIKKITDQIMAEKDKEKVKQLREKKKGLTAENKEMRKKLLEDKKNNVMLKKQFRENKKLFKNDFSQEKTIWDTCRCPSA